MFAYLDDWVFCDIFQSCFFTKALAYQMYTLGHTPYQFLCGYWMLRNKVDVVLGMNVCDVFSSLTLTICTVIGF